MAGSYEIRVITNLTSFTPIILTNAVPGKPYRELNNWGTFDFKIPTLDSQAVECIPDEREVQVWRDGACIWWGVIIKRSHDGDDWTTVQCYGLEWYFSRRLFGPVATNYATNASFDAGLSGWEAVNCTASVDTSWKVDGTQSVLLTATTYGLDSYLRQFVTVSGHVDQPVAYFASGVFRVDPTVNFLGPAYGERGLFLQRIAGGVVQPDYLWEPITYSSPLDGSEVQVATPGAVSVPTGTTQTVEIRLYCPGGTINWDHVRVLVEESVSTPVAGEDAATLIGRIVDYAQHGTGKSDLNIGFSSQTTDHFVQSPATGYGFFDSANCWESISAFVSAGVCDVGITWNAAGTQRTFNVWKTRGSLKADLQIDLATSGRLAAMVYEEDGEQTATKVRAIGQGTGATREISEAVDTTSTAGLVLEKTINASIETPVGQLASLAAGELARTKRTPLVPRFTTHENAGAVIANLDLGDTIPVVIAYGWIQENDTRRVVGISIDCDNDVLEPTVN